jgi:hypothetical protein
MRHDRLVQRLTDGGRLFIWVYYFYLFICNLDLLTLRVRRLLHNRHRRLVLRIILMHLKTQNDRLHQTEDIKHLVNFICFVFKNNIFVKEINVL